MRMLVVTDLDGTLLDHQTYSYAAAQPALDALRAAGIPLVLATSKTAAEVAPLHAALGLGTAPAIIENGAGIIRPSDPDGGADDTAYVRIRNALADLPPDLRTPFTGFGDMTVAEVADLTGLSLAEADHAKTRQFSEPGLWSGDAKEVGRFQAALASQGITARQGGRFLTLSHGRTKADALRLVAQDLGATFVVALGDAPNDTEMLEAADRGVIIRNSHGAPLPPLAGEASGRIERTTQDGPIGWNTAVLQILRAESGR